VITFLFKEEYLGAGGLIVLWGFVFAFQAVRMNWSLVLQVAEDFRFLTLGNIVTAGVTVISGLGFVYLIGAPGALWGMIFGEGLLGLLYWKRVGKLRLTSAPESRIAERGRQ
jgi:O-antigen/teichoic acid export membrane protein